MRRHGWMAAAVTVFFSHHVMAQVVAPERWTTNCRPGLYGQVECTHVGPPPAPVQSDTTSTADIVRRGFEYRPSTPDPNVILDNSALQRAQQDAFTAYQRGIEDQRAENARQQARQDALVMEARRAILADPEHAEAIARMYGVRLSPETQQAVNSMRASKMPPSAHRMRVERNQKSLARVRMKVAEASQTCQAQYDSGKIKTLAAKTDCSRKLVMPMVKTEGLPVDVYEDTYSKIKALARKVDKGEMTQEEMAEQSVTIDQDMSRQVLARIE
ncbi:MAG: hypothetical protein AB7L92_05645 [Alphaproteobacteria bacterium]